MAGGTAYLSAEYSAGKPGLGLWQQELSAEWRSRTVSDMGVMAGWDSAGLLVLPPYRLPELLRSERRLSRWLR